MSTVTDATGHKICSITLFITHQNWKKKTCQLFTQVSSQKISTSIQVKNLKESFRNRSKPGKI